MVTANKPCTVLFYGDSWAADWPFPAVAGVNFINQGVPGEDTVGALRRFGQIGAVLRPELMVLQLGINDLVMITYAPAQRVTIIDLCQTNLRQPVGQAVSLGITVILSNIFPPAQGAFDSWKDNLADLVPEVSQANEYLC